MNKTTVLCNFLMDESISDSVTLFESLSAIFLASWKKTLSKTEHIW